MMKRTVSLLICLMLCAVFCFSAFASPYLPRVNDTAGLLDGEQEEELTAKFDELSERLGFDIAAVTADDLGGKTAMEYADDYFDYNGFGIGDDRDGALLLISVEPGDRVCWISTSGSGQYYLDDGTIDDMLDMIVDGHLRDGEYYEGIDVFADLCEIYVSSEGEPQSYDGGVRSGFSATRLLSIIAVGAAVGLIAAGIYVLVLKSKMRSVKMKASANDYVKSGSLNITNAVEIFLYSDVTRVRRESSSSGGGSSHTSSSGASHGGGGRSF